MEESKTVPPEAEAAPAKRKRAAEGEDGASPVKRRKTTALVVADSGSRALVKRDADEVVRTSELQAPTMLLSGHGAAVLSVAFSPSGRHLASGSWDKTILLWNVYGDCDNFCELRGHKNAVLQVAWTADSRKLLSGSADKHVSLWDVQSGRRERRLRRHEAFVNAVATCRTTQAMLSGGDDGFACLWDARAPKEATTITDSAPLTAVAFSADGSQLFLAGLSEDIVVWDARKLGKPLRVMEGHSDSITGLSLSPDGSFLLSNGMDGALHQWDVRPFCEGSRLLRSFYGHRKSMENNLLRCAWSSDGRRVTAGSGDRVVNVWDADSAELVYRLPGHKGCVNEVAFHPQEPVLASASSDKLVYMGEIAPPS